MNQKFFRTRILIASVVAGISLTAGTMAFAEDPAPTHEVAGHVTDGNKEPVAYANVILLNASDSTFVQGATTDENGSFIIIAPTNIPKYIWRANGVSGCDKRKKCLFLQK